MSTPLRRMALRLLAYLDAAYFVAPPVPKSFHRCLFFAGRKAGEAHTTFEEA
jgi:hypothetical protein